VGDLVIRNLRTLLVGAALCASLATASAAQASVLFSDTFDAENGGASALNYTSFAKWTVTGQVDLVKEPDYGIGCQDGGSCVDLDGTAGPGSITSQAIAFGAGQHLVVGFDLSGNQRREETDDFGFEIDFSLNDINGLATISGYPGSPSLIGSFANVTGIIYNTSVPNGAPWTHYSLEFTPVQAGSLTLSFSTTSADDVGPLIDNVSVTTGAVPEPAGWALMIGGFGLAGAALRRRRTAVAAA